MKITNVKVEMFNWTTEAWKTGVGTSFGNTRQLGIVTVETDEGITLINSHLQVLNEKLR